MRGALSIIGLAGLVYLLSEIPDPDVRKMAFIIGGVFTTVVLALWMTERKIWRRFITWVREYEKRNQLTEEEEQELNESLFI